MRDWKSMEAFIDILGKSLRFFVRLGVQLGWVKYSFQRIEPRRVLGGMIYTYHVEKVGDVPVMVCQSTLVLNFFCNLEVVGCGHLRRLCRSAFRSPEILHLNYIHENPRLMYSRSQDQGTSCLSQRPWKYACSLAGFVGSWVKIASLTRRIRRTSIFTYAQLYIHVGKYTMNESSGLLSMVFVCY